MCICDLEACSVVVLSFMCSVPMLGVVLAHIQCLILYSGAGPSPSRLVITIRSVPRSHIKTYLAFCSCTNRAIPGSKGHTCSKNRKTRSGYFNDVASDRVNITSDFMTNDNNGDDFLGREFCHVYKYVIYGIQSASSRDP